MSFFKKAGKSISSAFKKAPSVVSSIFKKGEELAGKVGSGLDKVGDVLGKVADVGGNILSNPLTEAAATALGGAFGMPEAGVLLGSAGKGLQQLKRGSDLARQGANISRTFGGASGALSRGDLQGGIAGARSGIQKAKEARDAAGVAGPMFA